MTAVEEAEIQAEDEKVREESYEHDPVEHPSKYPIDRIANFNKKISISIIFLDECEST